MSKICSKCGLEKDESQFRVDNKSKDKLGYWCKDCDRDYKREYYAKNRDKLRSEFKVKYKNDESLREKTRLRNQKWIDEHKDQFKATHRVYKNDLQNFVDSLKTPCAKCGEERLWLLQFHHIDPSKKEFQVQATRSREKILEESKKCVCLCSNCHTEYHYFYGKKPKQPKESLEQYLSEGFNYELCKNGGLAGNN